MIGIDVYNQDEVDFRYMIYANEIDITGHASDREGSYWRAEVHLTQGGQDYDVMGWTEEQIANDLLDQYERHLNFLNHMH